MSKSDADLKSGYEWDVISAYFRGEGLTRLVRHQIESYNDFVNQQIPRTLAMFNPVHVRSDQDLDAESGLHRLEVWVSFTNFKVFRPVIHENNGSSKLMMPSEARLRNFSYSSAMTVDLQCKYLVRSGPGLSSEQTLHMTVPNVPLGKLPVMLRSRACVLDQYFHAGGKEAGECDVDPGGYFIVNGSEKTCVAQERPAENTVACYQLVRSGQKSGWTAEFKSVPDDKCISPKQVVLNTVVKNKRTEIPGVTVSLNRLRAPVPLVAIYRALGVMCDKDICSYIVGDVEKPSHPAVLDACEGLLLDGRDVVTQEDAVDCIVAQALYAPFSPESPETAKRRSEFADDVLRSDLFPHCKTREQRLRLLGYMTESLLKRHLGLADGSDRDSYVGKRIDLTGALLNNLVRNYVNKMVKDMTKHIVREINTGSWKANGEVTSIINATNVYKIVKSPTLENGIKRALSTGDFGIKHVNTTKVGVAQVLKRLTTMDGLSHARRVNTPIDKSGKLIPPRKLHGTSWGYMCPAETPEGHSVGVVKNLSYLTLVTIPSDPAPLHACANSHTTCFADATASELATGVKVFVNGCWIGIARDPVSLFNDAKARKRSGVINSYASIVFDYGNSEIRLCNDAGRLVRPLLIVEDGKLLLKQEHIERLQQGILTWDNLITGTGGIRAVIEYVDPAEQEHSLVAMRQRMLKSDKHRYFHYTHCEIHPSTIFGVLASCIPFPEHNQSPRNTYQCAMGKQAIGTYATNYQDRLDKNAHVLTYPTRPLVDTRVMAYIAADAVPSGTQVTVAIMTHSGYNQEDSILFNKASIDRGLFHATVFSTEKDEDKKLHGDEEIRTRPDPSRTRGMKLANYDKLGPNGLVAEGTRLNSRDIVIGKVMPIREARNDVSQVAKFSDQSRIFRTNEPSYVDKNYEGRNGDGYHFCKTRVRTSRKPVIGDKFSSRHGQKGTIGNIIPEEDMPFTASGIRPDLIINPHAIPSRMTIAQLKETLLGKALLTLGLYGDGTSFGELALTDICKELSRLGFESTGNELMYNGETGEAIETSIFIGPVFYQRLKHMVNDKQHSRANGPMVSLTRQPAEGRSRDGGLRYGEMERDCMCSHGAASFNKERIYDASDSYSMHVCRPCGTIAAYNQEAGIHQCRNCGNRVDFARVEVPYAFKLLSQELMTMNVVPRLHTTQ